MTADLWPLAIVSVYGLILTPYSWQRLRGRDRVHLALTALGCAVALAVCLLASDAHPQIPSSDCKCMECRCAAHPATDVDLSPPPTDP